MFGAICFKINKEIKAKIYAEGTFDQIEWGSEKPSVLGDDFSIFEAKGAIGDKPYIVISETTDGEPILRLIETKRYRLKLESKLPHQLPRFQNEGNKFLVCSKDSDSVTFQFINYLGKSKIIFDDCGIEKVLKFEVVPDKISYEDDYIKLTEALADICSELLLDYSGSTSNVFSSSVENQKTLLEQFIFLRQFCYSHNVRSLFESIKRNPDRRLNQEDEMKPAGMGIPSRHFYTNPFSFSREWIKIERDHPDSFSYMPQTVAISRKHDSVDTPANRFIKMALHRFDSLCVKLRDEIAANGRGMQIECLEEANAIHRAIEDVLMDNFFDEIGTLDIIPQNNQVLQKREGYSQVFSAYSMIDLALQLDWKGKDDVYEGESKNVALLYEYWLFFELFRIIKSIDGCTLVQTEENPFLVSSDRGLTVSLKQGNTALQSFEIMKYGVKVNLYYNREFSYKTFETTMYAGSYSRPFRPDFTIAIFPNSYKKEEDAIREGCVSYVHFDAKYRISDLTSVIGHGKDESADEEEIAEDKIGSIVNTYKLGDLMKMHTYNDAIRRTVGSYVLYPGSYSEVKQGNERFSLFEEVLPGVGAFSIKPSNNKAGENELRQFIESIICERMSQNSRLNRMNYFSDIILKEPPSVGNTETKAKENCVIGYIRGDEPESYYAFLKKKGKLEAGSEFLFYFYAIKGSAVYSHHKDVFTTGLFRFYVNDINITGTYNLEPVLCRIISNELMSRTNLVKKLNDSGFETSEEKHSADFYYVLKVRVEKNTIQSSIIKTADVNAQNGNDTFSPHSPKVIPFQV